jgi:hypothetical protein
MPWKEASTWHLSWTKCSAKRSRILELRVCVSKRGAHIGMGLTERTWWSRTHYSSVKHSAIAHKH